MNREKLVVVLLCLALLLSLGSILMTANINFDKTNYNLYESSLIQETPKSNIGVYINPENSMEVYE